MAARTASTSTRTSPSRTATSTTCTTAGSSHTDGIQFAAQPSSTASIVRRPLNVTIRHNTIYGMGADGSFGTSAIISNHGGDTNILIDSNLLAGGAFTLYCEQGATGPNYRVSTTTSAASSVRRSATTAPQPTAPTKPSQATSTTKRPAAETGVSARRGIHDRSPLAYDLGREPQTNGRGSWSTPSPHIVSWDERSCPE